MTAAAFENDYKLVRANSAGEPGSGHSGDELAVPGGTGLKDFMDWVNALPEREPPTYLGLPANAEKMLLVGHGQSTIRNLQLVTNLLDEGEQVMAEATEGA